MGYLFIQTLFWIILAFLLGLLLGWLLRGVICGRDCKEDDSSTIDSASASSVATSVAAGEAVASIDKEAVDKKTATKPAKAKPAPAAADEIVVSEDMRPKGLSAPNGEADDLKRIKGVGPVIEETLNGLGVYHFTQVADFSEDNIKWVDNFISFPGRIQREQWVSQASDLAKGAQTEFASRYDKGEVGEDNPNT